MTDWKFADPPNVAVISTKAVVSGETWIAHVSHDADDGAWQFHGALPEQVGEADAVLVSLRSIVERDPTVLELADLPLGWRAWRNAKTSKWKRAST